MWVFCTHRHLLHLLLHSVDCSGGSREGLDGLTSLGQDSLMLDGYRLKLWWRHDALNLWLKDWRNEKNEGWFSFAFTQLFDTQTKTLLPFQSPWKPGAGLWWQMTGFWMKRDCPPLEAIITVCAACVWMGRGVWLWVWTRVWTGKFWVCKGTPWVCICI